jgi:hypothetical protein
MKIGVPQEVGGKVQSAPGNGLCQALVPESLSRSRPGKGAPTMPLSSALDEHPLVKRAKVFSAPT